MSRPGRAGRLFRSLYARLALVYLASLIVMSLGTAWIAVGQFDHLGREWLQRSQLNLASNLKHVLEAPLSAGVDSAGTNEAAKRIMTINPALSLYVLDAHGKVIDAYGHGKCGVGQTISLTAIHELLSAMPMLPVYATVPCHGGKNVFSAAPVTIGPAHTPGYLFVVLEAKTHMSMVGMWQTSSISRSLLIAGGVALLLSAGLGLLLFALLTRRFSRLTRAVQRFARGDYSQRIEPVADDEIGQASRAFNELAATIEAQLGALRENDRQRRELVANLSHDFRTPLTSLRGYAQQLRAGLSSTEHNQREQLDAILNNVSRLSHLADQLSLLARVDVSERPLRIDTFPFAELAHDIAGKFGPQAHDAGVALSVECADTTLQVAADLEMIDRALTNLVDNALRAAAPGGRVQIRAHAEAGDLAVSVIDDGVGLSAEELPLVTQRFYRTASGRTPGDGTGLGLAIVAEICERHDSRLTLVSTPGAGTQANFRLALA
jgi:two-component system OmpR family sensor kinase